MSVKEMSEFLVSEGFSIVGNNAWEKGNVLILLDKGFLYAKSIRSLSDTVWLLCMVCFGLMHI